VCFVRFGADFAAILSCDADVGGMVHFWTFGLSFDSRVHPFSISLSSFDSLVCHVVVRSRNCLAGYLWIARVAFVAKVHEALR